MSVRIIPLDVPMAEFDAQWYGGFDTFEEAITEYTRDRGLPSPKWNLWRR